MKIVRRPFGKEVEVSLFTLGTMRALESSEAMYAVVKEACLAGINHIETSPSYGPAQKFLGESLQKLRFHKINPQNGWVVTSKILPGITFSEGQRQLQQTLVDIGIPKIDNLAVHGLNLPEHLTWALHGDGIKLIQWAKRKKILLPSSGLPLMVINPL